MHSKTKTKTNSHSNSHSNHNSYRYTPLASFYWSGITANGETLQGVLASPNVGSATKELHSKGILIKKICKKRAKISLKKSIRAADIAFLVRQLATLIEAGLPLLQALESLIQAQTGEPLKTMLSAIQKAIRAGQSLSESLQAFPSYFNTMVCHLIQAGEMSGTLDVMLLRVANYLEKMESVRKKMRMASAYPLIVLFISVVVTGFLLAFVVPQFEMLFKNFGAPLPALTRFIMVLSQLFKMYWHSLSICILAVIFILRYAQKKSVYFADLCFQALKYLPFIGSFIQTVGIARFARTLSITFAAGLTLLEAIRIAGRAANHRQLLMASDMLQERVTRGETLSQAMLESSGFIFPAYVCQMTAIGEESGTLDRMLEKVAVFYEEEVDNTLDNLGEVVEPILMSVLGVLVGGLVLALYLPISQLGGVI